MELVHSTLGFGVIGTVVHPFGPCHRIVTRILPQQINIPRNGQAVRWMRPPPGWIKINTDGAVRGRTTGASSCGGVFRDCRGFIIGAFSSFLGYNLSVLEAELRGIIIAIDGALTLGLTHVWLECDSTQAVFLAQNLVNDENVPESLREDWAITIEKMRSMSVRVSHIYREGNTVADKLTDYAIQTKEALTTWETAPYFVIQEANLDAIGHIYVRLRS